MNNRKNGPLYILYGIFILNVFLFCLPPLGCAETVSQFRMNLFSDYLFFAGVSSVCGILLGIYLIAAKKQPFRNVLCGLILNGGWAYIIHFIKSA